MIKKLLATSLALCSLFAPVLASAETMPVSGRLIQASGPAIYWQTSGGRSVFPNEETFYSWFSPYDFARIVHISDAEMASLRIEGNISYRPGSRLLKITTDPRVYAVDNRGVLRPIESESAAAALYGPNWAQFIDDVPDAFFVSYTIGAPIRRPSDFHPTTALTPTSDYGRY